jgi:hypothetical protein
MSIKLRKYGASDDKLFYFKMISLLSDAMPGFLLELI